MNRTDRLVALVMLLQSRRVITAAEMAEHFEVTERTVYRDLAALGECGVPIVGEPGVGYSLMRGYQLPPVMFSTQEAFALVTGGMLAERMTDASVREPIRTALGKLAAVLPSDLQARVHHLREAMQVHGRTISGPVPLSRVQMAMAERRVIQLRYTEVARGETSRREVEPLGLVYYLDHWHLIAWCRLRDDVRDFRVDRILECELLAEPTPPRADFDLAGYLSKCHQPESALVAELVFHPRLMETVRRHWGPALREENHGPEGVRVRLACGETTYLARWLLSMGDKVCVMAPESLRQAVISAARAAIAHHAEKKADS
ncbi:MAG: YafY family protein [Verrucomicrobiota bacterium]